MRWCPPEPTDYAAWRTIAIRVASHYTADDLGIEPEPEPEPATPVGRKGFPICPSCEAEVILSRGGKCPWCDTSMR